MTMSGRRAGASAGLDKWRCCADPGWQTAPYVHQTTSAPVEQWIVGWLDGRE